MSDNPNQSRMQISPYVFLSLACFILMAGSPAMAGEIPPESIRVQKGLVKKGDTATTLLRQYLPLSTIYRICDKRVQTLSLTSIRAGRPFRIFSHGRKLIRFEYEVDALQRLVLQPTAEGADLFLEPIAYDKQYETVSVQVRFSLFNAVRRAGEKNELAIRLSDIFAWDIDFIRDIQAGDRFDVLVEKRFRNGKLVCYGPVLAAFFNNRNTLYKAFLYTDESGRSGYYDEHGNSVEKAFLKAPLSFSKISSGYTGRRLHPILKRYLPHFGIDYAAPMGTPVKTVGDGTIVRIGSHKAMGRFVTVRHYNGYTTTYMHLKGFARGMRKNCRLAQGQVIGFVGMTGYATGPHLDFRMKKDGRPVNPLKHKTPSARPVRPEEMTRFLALRDTLESRMSRSGRVAVSARAAVSGGGPVPWAGF